jgi:hypothetical protein
MAATPDVFDRAAAAIALETGVPANEMATSSGLQVTEVRGPLAAGKRMAEIAAEHGADAVSHDRYTAIARLPGQRYLYLLLDTSARECALAVAETVLMFAGRLDGCDTSADVPGVLHVREAVTRARLAGASTTPEAFELIAQGRVPTWSTQAVRDAITHSLSEAAHSLRVTGPFGTPVPAGAQAETLATLLDDELLRDRTLPGAARRRQAASLDYDEQTALLVKHAVLHLDLVPAVRALETPALRITPSRTGETGPERAQATR